MKYIKISRSDTNGGYICEPHEAPGIVGDELMDINFLGPKTTITLTVVEMTEKHFNSLPEFDGW